MKEVLDIFIASLVGASIGTILLPGRRRPPVTATLIEILAIAAVFVLPQLVRLHWPESTLGIQVVCITGTTLLIYLPAHWWASRMRMRTRNQG